MWVGGCEHSRRSPIPELLAQVPHLLDNSPLLLCPGGQCYPEGVEKTARGSQADLEQRGVPAH